MWIFSETGFISAVQEFKDPDSLVVRARDYASLEQLAKSLGRVIEHTPENDYPYRLHDVSKSDFILFLMQTVDVLSYTNFKSQAKATLQPEFTGALSKVWSVMHDVEDYEARRYIP